MEAQSLVKFLKAEGPPPLKGGHLTGNIITELHGILFNTENFKDRWAIASYAE